MKPMVMASAALSVCAVLSRLRAGEPDRPEPKDEHLAEGGETREGVVGLRLGLTRAHDIENDSATSLTLAGRGEELRMRGILSSHGAHSFAIGAGSAGFEGGASLVLALGPRIPVHPNHGPFVRLGVRGSVEGNREMYDSIVELPRAEAGWQYLRGFYAFELGATYGVLLTGRFRVADSESRALGSGFASGAYAILQIPSVRIGGALQRLPASEGSAVQSASLYGCAIGAYVGLCVDWRWMHGDVVSGGVVQNTTSMYGGVTFGIVPPTLTRQAAPKPWSFAGMTAPTL